MDKFLLSERYRLELHWSTVEYINPGQCDLKGAYFSGPALQDAVELNNNDSIMLDFFTQYLVLVNDVYVAKFSWGEVIYNKDNTISLKNAKITHDTELNRVPKLENRDYLVIDTSDHEAAKHPYHLLYKTYVINPYHELYNFGGK
jgi:hypothetical protein